MKCERCEDILSEQDPSREYDPDCFGYLCPKHHREQMGVNSRAIFEALKP